MRHELKPLWRSLAEACALTVELVISYAALLGTSAHLAGVVIWGVLTKQLPLCDEGED